MQVARMVHVLVCNISRSVQGGVENIVNDLAKGLPSRGVRVTVGLTKGDRYNRPQIYRAAFPDPVTATIDDLGCGTRQARVEALMRTVLDAEPDIVLIARVYDAYEAVAKLKRKYGWPRLAVTIQAYEPHYLFDARTYRDHIDLCITSGELVRKAVCEWGGVERDRVISIPGGVQPARNKCRPRAAGGPLRIGYVGRLDPGQKRIMDLPVLLDELDERRCDYVAHVVGAGPAEGNLRRVLAQREEKGRVVFHGWQDHDALYGGIYESLDVLVHFAHTEGITIAPREAMVHGAVPVISRFPGLGNEGHFKHGENSLTFPVGDMVAAADCVFRLKSEAGLLGTLSTAALSSQQGKYGYEGALDAWADAFYACMKGPVTTNRVPSRGTYRDGRLDRLGISPWVAQRLRNLLHIRYQHTSGANEWPTFSGQITRRAVLELEALAESEDSR